MNKLILASLLGLTNCASLLGCFECGYNSVNGPGGAGDQGAAYVNSFIIQAARHPDWNGQNDRREVKDFTIVQPAQKQCNPIYNVVGDVIGCL